MQENDNLETRVYEVGFHIVPTLSPEAIKDEFEAVKKLISDKKDASVISEGQPSLKTLAYTLSKTVKAVKTNYQEAYFGWVKFSALPEEVEEIKKALDEQASVIRYLIVGTVKENTLMAKSEVMEEEAEEEDEKVGEDIDKTIDELVIQ